MPDSGGPGVLRWIAALLIRGPEAAFVLTDLDDAMEHDLARGVPLWRARCRYAVNVLGSAFSIWRSRWRMISVSWLDVKLGLRMLGKYPGLTCVAIFALAVAIPIGLMPMHAANALQAPPPFDEGDRIQVLRNYNVAVSNPEAPSAYDFAAWRGELTAFEALGATTVRASLNIISEDGRASPVRGAEVTASAFDILRVPPLLGRTLVDADEAVGAPRVAVIGYDFWQSRLEGAGDVVGQTIRVGRFPHTIVGVMPEGFLFPFRDHIWVPLRVSSVTDEHERGRRLTVFGRLSDGVSLEEAQAELATLGQRMAVELPDIHAWLRPEVVSFSVGLFGLPRGGLRAEVGFYVVQMLTLLVLVVACANVGMLIFARTVTRYGELAVRTALGASRMRVVSQLFAEALVFAVLAAGVGLLVGDIFSMRFDWMLEFFPYWIDLGVTPETALWAVSLAVFSAGVVGVVPALKVTGKSVQQSLSRAAPGRSGVRFGGMSSALIIADVTLGVVAVGVALAFSAGLPEVREGMGIEADQYLSAQFSVPRIEPAADTAVFDQAEFRVRVDADRQELIRRLTEEPGVRAVAMGSVLPGMDHQGRDIELEGEDRPDDGEENRIRTARVDIGFFTAFEQPILTGRGFNANDLTESRSVVIVNSNFVDKFLNGRDPIGRRVRYVARADEAPGPWYEIVGVVGHLGMRKVMPDRDAGMYHTLAPGEFNAVRLAIHAGDDPELFTPRLRAITSEVNPTAIISDPVALDEVFSFESHAVVWVTWGAGSLVGILLALSISGIYALMSFTVAERRREIGIRTALGAQRNRIVLTIAKRSLVQLCVGVFLGMAIAGRIFFESQRDLGLIPSQSPFVLTLVVGIGVMVLIGMLACVAPTLRALRIMPTEALRGGE